MTRFFILLFFSCIFISNINAQSAIIEWDTTYRLIKVKTLLKSEEAYAKKVEKDPNEAQYYVAMNKFRFLAKFTGNERDLNEMVYTSMQHVLQIKTGSADALQGLISKEFEFLIGKRKIWMPIQNQMIDAFKEEVKKKQEVLLYTLFTNEHKTNGMLMNTFMISEFVTEWSK